MDAKTPRRVHLPPSDVLEREGHLIDFVCGDRHPDRVAVMVARISWLGPHTPQTSWVERGSLPPGADDAAVQAALHDALQDAAYFFVCTECDTRQPNGWRLDDDICQGCAERNHGVVF